MTSKLTDAISAYKAAANPFSAVNKADDAEETGTDFSSVLKDAAKVAVGDAKAAEKASMSAIAGKADIRDVVNAVANAEMTLETVVNVRDKVINAYNEILRMPI